ncbi:MAG: glutathione synthase [Myxococcales bacterium]|nr:glutathione synthase [Myxococcales bacterium]
MPTGNALTLLFVMDPIQTVNIREDTTFALMLEAQRRGHRVYYADPDDLGVDRGRVVALAAPVVLRREPGRHVDVGPRERLDLDAQVDVAFQRKDPPVDAAYIAATQVLGVCRRTLVLNRPSSILAFNEKLFALHFADLMPPTIVTRDIAELRGFMAEIGGELVVKPLGGRGGEGVFVVSASDRNLGSILEQATDFGRRRAMGQQFLPAVREGDKRILLLEGEPLGALLRVPAKGEFRANLHVGGAGARGVLDDADRRIVERLAPELRREGLFFVGIDVIGGRLTEINVTSPTCIQEIDAIDGVCLETQVIERVELRAAERRGA